MTEPQNAASRIDRNAASEREKYLRALEDALGVAYGRKDGAEVVRLRKEIERVSDRPTQNAASVPDARPAPGTLCPVCKAGVFLGETAHDPSCKWAEGTAAPIRELLEACEAAFGRPEDGWDEQEDVSVPPMGITFGMLLRARRALEVLNA